MSNHMNSRWLLTIPRVNGKRLDLVAKTVRDCTLPGFDLEGSRMTGGGAENFIDMLPDRPTYRPLQFNFQVDEKLENYIDVIQTAFSYRVGDDPYFTASVIGLDGLGDPTGFEFVFENSRISSIGDLDYDNLASNKFMACNITLKYDNFIIKLNGETIFDFQRGINESRD